MKKSLIFLLSLCWSLCIGKAEEIPPTIRLLPQDFVQDSIKEVRWTTNTFAVKWTYTEAGAKKMLAFWETNAGQKVCIQIGNFKTPPFIAPKSKNPLTQTDWREGWLKRRTDKFMNLNKNDAKAVIAGMKSQ